MRYSITFVVAALSVGQTMAGPAHAHLHKHRDLHAKKDVVDWDALDWNAMGIDWTSAYWAGQHTSTTAPAPTVATPSSSAAPVVAEAPAPAKTTAAPVVVATPTTAAAPESSASSSDDIGSEVVALFKGLVGVANDIQEFGSPVANTGSVVSATGNYGNPNGHNMMKVESIVGYDFTNTYYNTQSVPITIAIWNKAWNGDPNLGACVAPETPALTFALAPGGSQSVAFQDGTLIGWSQAVSKITPAGQFDITWGEAKFTSTEGCGYDVSSIVSSTGNDYNMEISSLESTCVSDPTQNDWIANNGNWEDPVPIGNSDGSCYIPGGKATLSTKMGGYMS